MSGHRATVLAKALGTVMFLYSSILVPSTRPPIFLTAVRSRGSVLATR